MEANKKARRFLVAHSVHLYKMLAWTSQRDPTIINGKWELFDAVSTRLWLFTVQRLVRGFLFSLMGNSFTCPCSEGTNKEGVLVMKSDGDLLRFKRGVQAKEVVAANQGYRVVRCDSDRTVLWDSAELESHRLYFLVPEERARSRATFEKFWKVGESKGLVPPRSSANGRSGDSDAGSLVMSSVEFRKLAWAPQLRTIPEILSPEMVKAEADCAKMKLVQTPCSLGEQLGLASGTRPAAMMVS